MERDAARAERTAAPSDTWRLSGARDRPGTAPPADRTSAPALRAYLIGGRRVDRWCRARRLATAFHLV